MENNTQLKQEIKNSNDISTETALKEQYEASYLKCATHGITYQVKILTWVAWKLIFNTEYQGFVPETSNWSLGVEVQNAFGFHDLVLRYVHYGGEDISAKKTMYRFVQIKHKFCLKEKNKIQFQYLRSKHKKNQYSLIYLFRSYLNMINKFEKIKSDQILDMTVFTNMHMGNIKFLVPTKKDGIFDFEGKGSRYRIDLNIIQEYPQIMECLRKVMPNDTVILDFLGKLVFAVDQPSESEIKEFIIKDMSKFVNAPGIFYSDLYTNMFDWFLIYKTGKAPYLTQEHVKQYIRNTQNMLNNVRDERKEVDNIEFQLKIHELNLI